MIPRNTNKIRGNGVSTLFVISNFTKKKRLKKSESVLELVGCGAVLQTTKQRS